MKKLIIALSLGLFCFVANSQVQDAIAPVYDITRPKGKTTDQIMSMTRMVEGSESWNLDTDTMWRYQGGEWVDTGISGTSLPVDDTTILVQDPSDNTKRLRLDIGAAGTGETAIVSFAASNYFSGSLASDAFYFGREYGESGQRWALNRTVSDNLAFQRQSTPQTSIGGTYNDIYTLNATGTPSLDTDLIDKAYADTNYNGLQPGDNVSELVNDSYVDLTSNQLIDGNKTFYEHITINNNGDGDTSYSSLFLALANTDYTSAASPTGYGGIYFNNDGTFRLQKTGSGTNLGFDFSAITGVSKDLIFTDTDITWNGTSLLSGGASSDLDLTGNVLSLTNPTTPGNDVDLSTVPIIASALQNVVEDASPALGGNLNADGNSIHSIDGFQVRGGSSDGFSFSIERSNTSTKIQDTRARNLLGLGYFDISPLTGDIVAYGDFDVQGAFTVNGSPISGGSDDQTASEVPNTPAGNIAATNVQAAINELDTEKVATTIAGRTGDAVEAVMIQDEADYISDGDPGTNEVVFCRGCAPMQVGTSATIDIDKYRGYDDRATDAGTFTFSNLKAGAAVLIEINRASDATYSGVTIAHTTGAFAANTRQLVTIFILPSGDVLRDYKDLE